MKKNIVLYSLIIVFFILQSCGTSDKITASGFIQKRKYNKGYYVDISKQKLKKQNSKLVLPPKFINTADINKEQKDSIKLSDNYLNKEIEQNILIASNKNFIVSKNRFNNSFGKTDNSYNLVNKSIIDKGSYSVNEVSKNTKKKKFNCNIKKTNNNCRTGSNNYIVLLAMIGILCVVFLATALLKDL